MAISAVKQTLSVDKISQQDPGHKAQEHLVCVGVHELDATWHIVLPTTVLDWLPAVPLSSALLSIQR